MKKRSNLKVTLWITLTLLLICGIGLLSFTAWAENGIATVSDTAPCAVGSCGGSYTNGFCSNDATHYQAATLNNNGTADDLTDDYYEIANAGQLYWFANAVNTDNATYRTANAKLVADITVNSGTVSGKTEGLRAWTPIGNTRDNPFEGSLDGQGYTVSGLYFYSDALYDYYALGVVGWSYGAEIRNLNTVNFYFETNGYVGGIVGMAYGVTVENCYVQGATYAKDVSGATGGAIGAGGNRDNLVKGCLVNVKTRVTTELSEFKNPYWGDTPPVYIGGIVSSGGGTIENSIYITDAYGGEIQDKSGTYTVKNSYGRSLSSMSAADAAYILGEAWGQNVDNGASALELPVLGGARVYYGYTDCTSDDLHYSNTKLNPTKGHAHAYQATGHEIVYKCKYCGGDEQGRLTLTAPQNAVFSEGTTHAASYTCTLPGCTATHEISYCCAGGCMMSGTHTARVRVGDAEATLSFEISSNLNFPEDITIEVNDYWAGDGKWYYNGGTVKPTLTVKRGGTALTTDDYTVYYTNNTGVTTEAHATVVLKLAGYEGASKTVDFEIVPFDMTHVYTFQNKEDTTVTRRIEVTYGEPMWESFPLFLRPAMKASEDDILSFYFENEYYLVEGMDFEILLDEDAYRALNDGTHTVTVRGIGNFTGSRTFELVINRASFETAERFVFTMETTDVYYTGKDVPPTVSVYDTYRGAYLKYGVDYALNISDYTEPGTYSIYVYAPTDANYIGNSQTIGTYTVHRVPAKVQVSPNTLTFAYDPTVAIDQKIRDEIIPTLTLLNGTAYTGAFSFEYRKVGEPAFVSGLPTVAGKYEVRAIAAPTGYDSYLDKHELLPSDTVTVTVERPKATLTVYDQHLLPGESLETYESPGTVYGWLTEFNHASVILYAEDVVLGADGHTITMTPKIVYTTPQGQAFDILENFDITYQWGKAHSYGGWVISENGHHTTCKVEGCTVQHPKSGKHIDHVFTADTAAGTVSAVCGFCNGDAGMVTLHVPTDPTYNGTMPEIYYTGKIHGIDSYSIQYCANSCEDGCIHAGQHNVTLFVGENKASLHMTYKILPTTLKIKMRPVVIAQYGAIPEEFLYDVEGLVDGDVIASIEVQHNLTSTDAVGSFYVRCIGVTLEVGSIGDYDFDFSEGIITVILHTAHTFDADGFCTVCSNGYETPTVNGEGTYQIQKLGHLFWLSAQVNGGNLTVNAVLMGDLDLNAGYVFTLSNEGMLSVTKNGIPVTDLGVLRQWKAIGNEQNKYGGTFDGNGYTVRGLYLPSAVDCGGLFGAIGTAGTVKNLKIENAYIGSGMYIGSVVGINEGALTNCTSAATVKATNTFTGGIVGTNAGTLSDCSFSGTVIGPLYTGGIVGQNSGTVTRCQNSGSVSGQNSVGGIVGLMDGTSASVTLCGNAGAVSGTTSVGGVVGEARKGDMRNCYNLGKVSATTNFAGGIVGQMSESARLSYSYSMGEITCEGENGISCGIAGYCYENTVVDCYYLTGTATQGVYGGWLASGATAMVLSTFRSGEIAYLLNTAQNAVVWGQTVGTELHPMIGGAQVYRSLACDGTTVVYANTEQGQQQHFDADGNHACDACNATVGVHKEGKDTHLCEYCNKTAGECRDNDRNHKCDVCDASMGEHKEASGTHLCAYCEKTAGECRDSDLNHKCDVCDASMGEHKEREDSHYCAYCGYSAGDCRDGNSDHKCDICGRTDSAHQPLEGSHNCAICGERYTDCYDHTSDHICDRCGAENIGEHKESPHRHFCDYCDQPIGECRDSDRNHACDICLAVMGEHKEESATSHKCAYCEEPAGECRDGNNDHKCDVCGVTVSSHQFSQNSHLCPICGETVSSCFDGENDHVCDICGGSMGEHKEAADKHACDYCDQPIGECRDSDKNHACDVCRAQMGEHKAAEGTNICAYCEKPLTDCWDLDFDHACDDCGKSMGIHLAGTNSHICDYCGKAASECDDLNRDHNCDVCGKKVSEHDYAVEGEWNVGEGTHFKFCVVCMTYVEGPDPHVDENRDHVCEICSFTASSCTDTAPVDHMCDVCGKKLGEHTDHNSDHVCETCGGTASACEDIIDFNHLCDLCGKKISEHTVPAGSHFCSHCGESVGDCFDLDKNHRCDSCHYPCSTCLDGDKDHACDICGKAYGTHASADSDGLCDHCGKSMNEHVCKDENSDHICDGCQRGLTACSDGNRDHNCDICGATLSDHASADSDGLCDVCGQSMITHSCTDNDENHLCDGCGERLTQCTDENRDHTCEICKQTVGAHSSATGGSVCDYCGVSLETHTCKDENNDHICDGCGERLTQCADGNRDHHCDICKAELSVHETIENTHDCSICGAKTGSCEDRDQDHNCDWCKAKISEHSATAATCTSPAVCTECKETVEQARGHVAGNWTTVTEPTEDASGIRQKVCLTCGEVLEREPIDPLKKVETPTQAPEANGKDEDTDNKGKDTDSKDGGGCKSTVGGNAIWLLLPMSLLLLLKRKKKSGEELL